MRGVWVDPAARTVRVQGGATWGDVDRETQLFGLATPGGKVSTTGVGGLTLHGGFGWLRRKYGYSIDNLAEVEIVTADGQVRTRQRDGESGPLLGGARRGQQLRGRHRLHVPPAPGRTGGGAGGAVLRPGGRRARAPRLARLHGQRAGRGQLQCALLGHPGGRGLPGRAARARGADPGRGPRRGCGGGRARPAAATRAGHAAARPERNDALRHAAGRLRPLLSEGLALLLEVALPGPPGRGGDGAIIAYAAEPALPRRADGAVAPRRWGGQPGRGGGDRLRQPRRHPTC